MRATISLARLIRERQPRLYEYLFNLRRKHAVLEQVTLLEPLVHVSDASRLPGISSPWCCRWPGIRATAMR